MEARTKARPSVRIRTRAPPRRGAKRIEKIAADRPTPRWSSRLITRASSPNRAFRTTSMGSWRARAPTTPTSLNTSTRTASSSSASCDRPAGRRKKKAKKQRPRKGRSGQGSRRLKVEVLRSNAYRLKGDNDDILTNAWTSCVVSSLKIQSHHCLLNVCSHKSAPT